MRILESSFPALPIDALLDVFGFIQCLTSRDICRETFRWCPDELLVTESSLPMRSNLLCSGVSGFFQCPICDINQRETLSEDWFFSIKSKIFKDHNSIYKSLIFYNFFINRIVFPHTFKWCYVQKILVSLGVWIPRFYISRIDVSYVFVRLMCSRFWVHLISEQLLHLKGKPPWKIGTLKQNRIYCIEHNLFSIDQMLMNFL